jgi:hypothetical protein
MSNSSWKKNFFYPKGQYGLGSAYSIIQYDFEKKDHIKYLTMEKLREIINEALEFFTCTEEDIKEWFIILCGNRTCFPFFIYSKNLNSLTNIKN